MAGEMWTPDPQVTLNQQPRLPKLSPAIAIKGPGASLSTIKCEVEIITNALQGVECLNDGGHLITKKLPIV